MKVGWKPVEENEKGVAVCKVGSHDTPEDRAGPKSPPTEGFVTRVRVAVRINEPYVIAGDDESIGGLT
ncbi:hypothetical protein Ciccas_014194 [Cichlidogyrus casuarinus]|uniref:Uncharacterized protein n=1 Tax=Cichlidogyrus casuarinus TaxID=1844966 RepID=A0ABD2PNI8_9PLAT